MGDVQLLSMIKLRCSSEMQAGALYFDYAVWNFVCLDGRFVSGSNGIYTNLLGELCQEPRAKMPRILASYTESLVLVFKEQIDLINVLYCRSGQIPSKITLRPVCFEFNLHQTVRSP